jgi:hypothetical protein
MESAERKFDPSAILYGDLPRDGRQALAPQQGPFGEEVSAAHSYVVVEEVDDDNVTLAIAPWPEVDPKGGLSFAPEEQRAAAVADRPSLQEALRRRTTLLEYGGRDDSPELAEREIAAGDVFAIEISGPLPEDGDLREAGEAWVGGAVVDVTALARNVAKAAMLAALTGSPLGAERAARIAGAAEELSPPEGMPG